MLISDPSSIEHFGAVAVLPTNVFLATISLPPQFSPRRRRIDPVGGRGARAIWAPKIRSAHRGVFDRTAYDYDLAGRLDQVAQTGGSPTATFNYGFEPSSFSLIETVTGPHHLVTNEWEGTRNVLDSKTNTDFASTPETHSAYDYTVNDLGQRTAVDASGTAFGTSQRDRTWKYDSFGQLVSEADSNNAGFDRGFAFDDIGNRTASISGDTDPTASGAITYTPDALNQYDTITDPASQVSAPSYDADGNATSLSLRKTGLPAPAGSFEDATLIWDGENRLIEIKAANNTTLAKYQYDSQSRRIRRNESAAHDTAYLYDGWNPIAEYRLSAGTYDLHLTNLWGLDLSGSMQGAGGVGGLLAVNVSGTTYYPTYDGNGNVSEYLEHIIDSDPGTAGNQPLTETAVHFEYDAFGNILDFTETSTDLVDTFSHRFSTKQQDHESGLLYYGYRYFDPVTGRWPNRDPIEERGGTNLYGFNYNNALNWVDYLGREPTSGDTVQWPTRPGADASKADWEKFNKEVGKVFDSLKKDHFQTKCERNWQDAKDRYRKQNPNLPSPTRKAGSAATTAADIAAVVEHQLKLMEEVDIAHLYLATKALLTLAEMECRAKHVEAGGGSCCGCCILEISYRVQRPGHWVSRWDIFGGDYWVKPSGKPAGVNWFSKKYIRKPCKDVTSSDYPGSHKDPKNVHRETRITL